MAKKYRVTLTDDERSTLTTLISSGSAPARTLTHARILLKADQAEGGPAWTDEAIHDALDGGLSTIARVRERFVEQSLEAALHRRSSPRHRQRLLDGAEEAHLLAVACSAPPEGRERWTLRMLADKMVELEHVDHLSHETVRQVLKKRTQAVVEGGMVFPARGECRICLRDGRCAGCLPSAGGPTLSHRLLR